MLKKNKRPLILALGTGALLLGGALAYWLLVQQNILRGNVPEGAKLVPQDALFAVSVSTDEKQWQQLREYGTPQSQAAFAKQLQQLEKNLLTANGYNYQQDIKPWVGKEVTIAFLPPETPQSPNAIPVGQQSVVMVLPINDPLQAKQVLERARPQTANKFVERDYKGIKIRETPSGAVQKFSTTLLERSLVVSTDPKGTERIIDTYKGAASLGTTPGYSEALGRIRATDPFARLYFNVPVATAVAAANSARSLPSQNLASLQEKQGLATSVMLQPEGILFKGVSWLKPNSENKYAVENNAKIMSRRLPENTLMMTSGGNLERLWQDYVKGAQSNPIIPINPEALKAGIKSQLGLDLEQDLLPWMRGEFSLALIPAPKGVPSNLGAGVIFMVQASDRSRAEKSLQQIDQVMANQYQFQVQQGSLNNQPVVNWTSQLGGLAATHGWLDGNVAFLSLGAPIATTIVPQPQATLSDSELFKQGMPTELNGKNGSFFIDVDRTINTGNLALPQFSPDQKIFTNAIRSIGVTAGISSDRSSRFDIFVRTKKIGEPSNFGKPSISPTPQSSSQASPTASP
ncbi:DUF3352 domain-containing protein [Cyanobacteria bacterium FACHB-472]|nr:DUF3352 domain-containing protein [Cyanobacteria bacterium FACHB-472]